MTIAFALVKDVPDDADVLGVPVFTGGRQGPGRRRVPPWPRHLAQRLASWGSSFVAHLTHWRSAIRRATISRQRAVAASTFILLPSQVV